MQLNHIICHNTLRSCENSNHDSGLRNPKGDSLLMKANKYKDTIIFVYVICREHDFHGTVNVRKILLYKQFCKSPTVNSHCRKTFWGKKPCSSFQVISSSSLVYI